MFENSVLKHCFIIMFYNINKVFIVLIIIQLWKIKMRKLLELRYFYY